MRSHAKFEDLVAHLKETPSYALNDAGKQLLQKYYELISAIEEHLVPVIQKFTNVDPSTLKKELAVQIISTINSQEFGNEQFEIASRLDTLTSGGRQPIDSSVFAFNKDDKLLNYIQQVS